MLTLTLLRRSLFFASIDRMMSSNSNVIHNHYEHVLDAYKSDVYFTKTTEYKKQIQGYIIDLLNLQRLGDNNNNDSNVINIVDLGTILTLILTLILILILTGGGMGDLCVDLRTQLDKFYSFLCVDPSSDLINEARRNGIDSIIADALEFSLLDNKYDIILMKEMIHHIPIQSLTTVFQNIHKQLNPSGSIMIETRPVDTDFPFFNKVKEIWKTTQPPASVFISSLIESNYVTTTYEREYKVIMSKQHWYQFIRNRSFSELSLCSDDDIETGITELEQKYQDTDTLHFSDKLIFIIATKK